MFSTITDRTIEDVNRVKELLAKKYQNMTAEEQAEWDGTMKGRFNYQDMNRICGYVNTIRTNIRALYYYITGAYPSAADVPGALSTSWTMDDIPQSTVFEDMRQIINFTMSYLTLSTVAFDKYNYIYFNNIESALAELDSWGKVTVSTTPTTYSFTPYSNTNPLVYLNNFISTSSAKKRVELHSKLLPIYSGDGNIPYALQKAETIDLSNCWAINTKSDFENGRANYYRWFYGNHEVVEVILPTDRDVVLSGMFYKSSEYGFPNLTRINTERVVKIETNVFDTCMALRSIDLSHLTQTYLPGSLFANCHRLESLILPATITVINARCFAATYQLKTIKFLGTMAQWNAINKYSHYLHPEDDWNRLSALETVICTDGVVNI